MATHVHDAPTKKLQVNAARAGRLLPCDQENKRRYDSYNSFRAVRR